MSIAQLSPSDISAELATHGTTCRCPHKVACEDREEWLRKQLTGVDLGAVPDVGGPMNSETGTFWSTKYLLTRGIIREEGCEEADGYACRKVGFCSDPSYLFQKIGTDIHRTEEGALAKARVLVARKLKALDKQRADLFKIQKALGEG